MPARFIIIAAILIAVLAVGAVIILRQPFPPDSSSTPTALPASASLIPKTTQSQATEATKTIDAREIPGAASKFTFSAKIPETWQAESVPAIEAISFFNPAAEGANNLEKSQIFIRYFTANDFLTLGNVTIHSRDSLTIGDRPAVRYDIEKKPGAANFPSQPAWRNGRHIVTDIRTSSQNPSVFYVIAKRPDLDSESYESFLQSLQVNESTSLIPPVAEFKERITKKPFGIYITPDNSPVSPEAFTGYHTGVDVEFSDVEGDVTVHAISPGVVRVARRASGYGGIVAIEHVVSGEKVAVVYGHLKPSSLPNVGKQLAAGDTVGILGIGGTTETDYERKHLHFAVMNTAEIDLRGYVSTKEELSTWRDPKTLFRSSVM